MTNLNNIFPTTYLHPPSEEDLLFEAQELLDRHSSVPPLLQALHAISCPYMREAITLHIQALWHGLEKQMDERTGYYDSDGNWILVWLTIDSDMRFIIKSAHRQQAEQEMTNEPTHETPTESTQTKTTEITPKNKYNMKEKTVINITNHYHGNIGQHFDHVDTQYFTFDSDKDMNMHIAQVGEQHAACSQPSQSGPQCDMEVFQSLLTIPYRNRKDDCRHMIEVLTRETWSKKDRARMALALYRSGNVAVQREHIATFKQWWQMCCRLLHWDDSGTSYKESQLDDNEATRQIKLYL